MPNKPAPAFFWRNAMFFTLLQRVSLFAFGVISYMVLVRGFSTSTNGVWALYITIFSIFEAVKQGLVRNATIKFMGVKEYLDKNDEVQCGSLIINTAFSLATIFFFLIAHNVIAGWLQSGSLSELLIWSSMLIVLLIPYNHCEILLQSKFRFDILFRAGFIRQGLFFAGLLMTYFFLEESFTLFNILLLQVIALFMALLYIFYESRWELMTRFVYDKDMTRALFNFGKYTFGTNLFSGISRSLDHFVTASILGGAPGKTWVAYYNTVARINNMVDVPSLAAADVLYPKNVEALESEGIGKVKEYFEQMIAAIIAFIIPVSLIIFVLPGTVIDIVAGSRYEPAVAILQLTILFSMVRPLSYQFGSTLDAIGRPDINFWANAGLMFINLLLTLVMVKIFGGMGAAYATMINYSISFAVMTAILKKHVAIDFNVILRLVADRYYSFLKFGR